MEVRIDRRTENLSVDIRIKIGEVPESGYTVWLTQGTVEQVPFGGEVPVFVSLPDEAYEAIVRAGAPKKTDHVDEALTDTRAVRDRLLTLVENVVNHN